MKLPQSFDFRSLEIFVTMVRAGGMTPAAKSLGLTQSAVSQSIAALENALGTTLLDRTRRPLQLTPNGMILFEKAQSLLGMAMETVQTVSEPGGHKMEMLHMAMADSIAFSLGPYLAEKLKNIARHWRITSGLSSDHERALEAGDVDMIISSDQAIENRPDYEHHLIAQEQFLIAAPISYTGPTDQLDQLMGNYKLVRYSLRSFAGRKVEQNLNRWQIKPPLWLEIDSPMAQLAMIANGVAWGITTPIFLLQAPQKISKLRLFRPPKSIFQRHIYLVSRGGQYGDIPDRIARASRAIIRQKLLPEIAEMEEWLPGLITVPE